MEVEYEFDMDRRFNGFEFVDADSPLSRWSIRLPYLDLPEPGRFREGVGNQVTNLETRLRKLDSGSSKKRSVTRGKIFRQTGIVTPCMVT